MALHSHITKPKRVSIFTPLYSLSNQTHNAQLLKCTSNGTEIKTWPRTRRWVGGEGKQVLGSSLPMYGMLHLAPHHCLYHPHGQISHLLSLPHSLPPFQPQMLIPNPRPRLPHIRPSCSNSEPGSVYSIFRPFWSVVISEDNNESGVEFELNDDVEIGFKSRKSCSDPKEVERVCRLNGFSYLESGSFCLNSRPFCSNVVSEDNENDDGFENSNNGGGDDVVENGESGLDAKEIERFCRVAYKLFLLDRKMVPRLPLFSNLKSGSIYLNSRGFCSVGTSENNNESDDEFESNVNDDGDDDDDVEDASEDGKSGSDPKEVERVCKVVDELFALDRNMEAVLDECGVNLSHDLVVDVLERFRHVRKPAFRFFCWAGGRPGFNHDSRTYNKMMAVLGKTRQFETMVTLLEEMGEKGLLTIETFEIAIKAFADAKERKKAVGIFEVMKKHKFRTGADTINCLLDALGRAKLGKEAQKLFDKLKERFTPNLRTYTVLLNGWCRVKNLMEAGKVWNEMIDRGFKPDIVAHNTMLEGLLRGKKWSDAVKLFEVMKTKGPTPNVRSYTILIRDFCKRMKMREAVEYFDQMLDSGCEPDAVVYTCLITGFGNAKKMDQVYGLLKEMKEKGYPPDARTYNALIKLMTNRQMPDDAVRIYKKMIGSCFQPTIHTFNMMMKSYFVTRNYEMGCEVWEEMNRKGCCPDENSYIIFIGGLIRQGRSEEACKYLEEMIERGMKAPQLDYNKFAADFSRRGKPDILEELAKKMKFAGKFEVSNIFARWAEMMKKRVKRRDPIRGSL